MRKYRNDFDSKDTIKKIKEIENSPQMQRQLNLVKNGMKEKVLNPLTIGCGGILILFLLIVIAKDYFIVAVLILWYFGSKYLKKNKMDIGNSYANNFILPVLKAILPDTEINYFGGIDTKVHKRLLYDSEKYYSNCHITFGDDIKTEFCNMQSFHYATDSDGNDVLKNDFVGQVLLANMKTGISGHIRIVPIIGKYFIGIKNYGWYGKKRKDEKEIQTESIDFNNSYSIFSTDDFYTRLILDPNIIDILTKWEDKMRVSLYMNGDFIAISFESNENLFPTPSTKEEIDNLSLSGEYEKIREKLVDFYELIDIVRGKL